MNIQHELENMAIGDRIKAGGYKVTRVHGGWLYYRYKDTGDYEGGAAATCVFVPLPKSLAARRGKV